MTLGPTRPNAQEKFSRFLIDVFVVVWPQRSAAGHGVMAEPDGQGLAAQYGAVQVETVARGTGEYRNLPCSVS